MLEKHFRGERLLRNHLVPFPHNGGMGVEQYNPEKGLESA